MILCCGEALIDMIPRPTTDGRDGFVPHSGGAIFNTAIALGRLGIQTGMFTGLSRDQFGQQLAADLKASHVDTTLVAFSERPTTLAFVHLVDGHATYDFYDENSAGRMLTTTDLPAALPDVSALYLGGISLCNAPAGDAYVALATRQAPESVIVVDPNIRPSFIRDAALYRERLYQLLDLADIVKVSDEDLNWITPDPISLEQKIRALLDRGPALVVLTRGGAGADAYHRDGRKVSITAPMVRVVDTVGAGDTFNAGLMAQAANMGLLTRGALAGISDTSLEQILQFGAAVAAVTVSRAGANPPWRHELDTSPPPG